MFCILLRMLFASSIHFSFPAMTRQVEQSKNPLFCRFSLLSQHRQGSDIPPGLLVTIRLTANAFSIQMLLDRKRERGRERGRETERKTETERQKETCDLGCSLACEVRLLILLTWDTHPLLQLIHYSAQTIHSTITQEQSHLNSLLPMDGKKTALAKLTLIIVFWPIIYHYHGNK